MEPPAGEGRQVGEMVSEGSPISPCFLWVSPLNRDGHPIDPARDSDVGQELLIDVKSKTTRLQKVY